MKKKEREVLLRARLSEMKSYENVLYQKGVKFIGGVDEVGRGPLAGPVYAACVVLPEDFDLLGVDDSKKLTEKKREELYEEICATAISYGVGFVENNVIDEIGIVPATKKSMLQAVAEANKKLLSNGNKIEHLLIDAVKLNEAGIPYDAIIGGDSKSVSVAAASIIAKVSRDRLMKKWDKVYPGYSFSSNKGYGTKAHYEGLNKLGPCPIHRRTFL